MEQDVGDAPGKAAFHLPELSAGADCYHMKDSNEGRWGSGPVFLPTPISVTALTCLEPDSLY